ncbi:MAG: hypothetical protein ACXVRV_11840 [Gaiellaceae bacterium]
MERGHLIEDILYPESQGLAIQNEVDPIGEHPLGLTLSDPLELRNRSEASEPLL